MGSFSKPSPKPSSMFSGCVRKKRLKEKWANRIVEDMRKDGIKTARSYFCSFCGGYHVTSGKVK